MAGKRKTVEQVAVHVVGHVPREVFVVNELQGIEVGIGLRLDGIAQVGIGQDQERVGYPCPDLARFYDQVNVAEGGEPEAFLCPDVRALVVVVRS